MAYNEARNPKNMILCSDGTGNSGGKRRGTNVWRLYRALDRRAHLDGGPRQLAFYDDGVGTDRLKVVKLLGGIFGWGVSRNIRELYRHLVRNYQPKDRIYLFGFSRGAFTVRALSGMIDRVGILDMTKVQSEEHLDELIGEAYGAYRGRRHVEAAEFKNKWALKDGDEPINQIRCIGVWDSVDAVGVPVDELKSLLPRFLRLTFHDKKLASCVQHGLQALALDDERRTFHPDVWDEHSGEDEPDPRVYQVWFAGSHSNVGGGYPKEGLAHISLEWMIDQVGRIAPELRLSSHAVAKIRRRADINDKLYDSRSGFGMYYRYAPRDLYALMRSGKTYRQPKVHASVFERIARATRDYAPPNVPKRVAVVDGELGAGAQKAYERLESIETDRHAAMDRVPGAVRLRKCMHLGLVVLTLVALAIVFSANGFWGSVGELWNAGIWTLVGGAVANLGETSWPVVVGLGAGAAVVFLLRALAAKRIRRAASKLWRY